MSTLALVLAGGMGSGLGVITQQRAKPALPYGGKYRVIDFALSNLVNSYLFRIALLVQYQSFSLMEYLGTGEPWGLHRQNQNGLQIWQPYLGRTDLEKYLGTADAVYQNRKYIAEDGSDTLLILGGDLICMQDYREMLRFHQSKGADLTIACMHVPIEEAHRYGLMQVDADSRITSFIEKPESPRDTLASLGTYIFNTAYLLRLLEEDAANTTSSHDFGKNVIPPIVRQGRAYAYPFSGYWSYIGGLKDYWQSNMELLAAPSPLNLHDPDWVIHTRCAEKPPAEVRQPGSVVDSLISDGCVIHGEVVRSILSPGVRVEPGAVVRDSMILSDTLIQAGAVLNRSVIDQEVTVGANARVGSAERPLPDAAEQIPYDGITAVGMRASIPEGTIIGRGCQVESEATPADFESHVIPDGEIVHHRAKE